MYIFRRATLHCAPLTQEFAAEWRGLALGVVLLDFGWPPPSALLPPPLQADALLC